QFEQDKADIFETALPSVSVVDRAVTLLTSEMAYLLGKRTSDALLTLPRDVLRRPDYRDVRPVAYYTFDPEDMDGAKVLDLAGEAHGLLSSTNYTRPSDPCGVGTAIASQCYDGITANQAITMEI